MSTIVDELKGKFGGTGNTIAEVVKTMEGGGGSGGGVFEVVVEDIEGETPGSQLSKTAGEIKTAIESGMQVVVSNDSDIEVGDVRYHLKSLEFIKYLYFNDYGEYLEGSVVLTSTGEFTFSSLDSKPTQFFG